MLPKILLGGLTLAMLSLASGCGGSADATASSAASSCGFVGPIPKAPKLPPVGFGGGSASGSSVKEQAEAQGLNALETYLGPYLRGHVTVYRGTFAGHDNQGVLRSTGSGGPKLEDQTIPMSAAVASLVVKGNNAVLTVHAMPEHKYVVLSQTAQDKTHSTSVGIILSDVTGGGNSGSCVGCVPEFGDRPASIAFDDVETKQLVALTNGGTATLRTHTTANLQLVNPCGLAFADIAELNEPASIAFFPSTTNSDEMIYEMEGYGYSPRGCYQSYTIELYVNTTNLADYGVRNFRSMPSPYCGG